MIGNKELIPWCETQGSKDAIHSGGGILDEREVVGIAAKVMSHRNTCLIEHCW